MEQGSPDNKNVQLGVGERMEIATALRLGRVASKAAELDGLGLEKGEVAALERGDAALVMGETKKDDVNEAVKNAVEQKLNGINNVALRAVANSYLVKPFVAAWESHKVKSAIRDKGGNIEAAMESLGLDNVMPLSRESDDYSMMRARLALGKTEFQQTADEKNSFLTKGEKVEKLDEKDAEVKEVNKLLKDLYVDLEDAKKNGTDSDYAAKLKEYKNKIDTWQREGRISDPESIMNKSGTLHYLTTGNKVMNYDALRDAAKGVEALVKHGVDSKKFDQYLEEGHLSLYNASVKEGLNKKRVADGVVDAVVRAGLAGGIAYTFMSTDVRKGIRGNLGKFGGILSTNAGLGAVAGAIFGAVRGVGKARRNISKSEYEHSTDAEELLTMKEKIERKSQQTDDEGDEKEGGNNGEAGRAKKQSMYKRIVKGIVELGPVAEAKRAKDKEDLEGIEKLRDRKSAKELYEDLERKGLIVELFNQPKEERISLINQLKELDTEGFRKLIQEVAKNEKYQTKDGADEEDYQIPEDLSDEDKGDLKKFYQTIENGENEELAKRELEGSLAEIRARETVSAEKKIDLIKFSKGNIARERYLLDKATMNAEELVDTGRVKGLTDARIRQLNEKTGLSSEEAKIIARQAVVNAIQGAIAGGAAGAVVGYLRDSWTNRANNASEALSSDSEATEEVASSGDAEVVDESAAEAPVEEPQEIRIGEPDDDGGWTVYRGEEQIVGAGSEAGIEIDPQTGKIAEADLEMLRSKGIEIEEVVSERPYEGGVVEVSAKEFFDLDKHAEVAGDRAEEAGFKIENVEIKGWVAAPGNKWAAEITNFEAINDSRDLTARVVTLDENINTEGLKVVLRPAGGESDVAFTFDVNADGTVTIPGDTPANMSLFEGETFKGGSIQIVREMEGGNGFESLGTAPNRGADVIENVSFKTPGTLEVYSYTTNGEPVNVDEAIVDFDLGRAGVESMRNSGPVEFTEAPIQNSITVNGLRADDSEATLTLPQRTGNYSELHDAAYDKFKESTAFNGRNLVRETVDPDYAMTAEETESAFVAAIENGNYSTNAVLHDYLEQMGNSPEQIVTMRAMLGQDLDTDVLTWNIGGVDQVIDTEAEINEVAEILRNSADADAYSAFVNDTYALLYQKLNGGEIRLVNYANEPYEFTTQGYIEKATNNFIQLFTRKKTACNGLGLELLDKDGKSVYNLDVARKIWKMPNNAKLDHVTERLNCCQKTADVTWERVAQTVKQKQQPENTQKTQLENTQKTQPENTKTEDENTKTEGEKTEREKTEREKTEREKTEREKTEREKTEREKTEREKTEREKTEREKTEKEKTEDETTPEPDKKEDETTPEPDKKETEKTQPEKTEGEKTESEKTQSEKTESEKTGNENTGKTDYDTTGGQERSDLGETEQDQNYGNSAGGNEPEGDGTRDTDTSDMRGDGASERSAVTDDSGNAQSGDRGTYVQDNNAGGQEKTPDEVQESISNDTQTEYSDQSAGIRDQEVADGGASQSDIGAQTGRTNEPEPVVEDNSAGWTAGEGGNTDNRSDEEIANEILDYLNNQ